MPNNTSIFERILVFFPLLFLFYYCMFESIKSARLQNLFWLITVLFTIQIITHLSLLYSGYKCSPSYINSNVTKMCNLGATAIGIAYLVIIIMCILRKAQTLCVYFALFVAIYIITSHLVTIHPLRATFVSNGIQLPLFDINSYIFSIITKHHETKLRQIIQEELEGKNGSIVDAGAYIGDTSIPLAMYNKNLTIYAIEPSQKNYRFIQKIKDINGISNVTAINSLLSNGSQYYDVERLNQANATYHVTAHDNHNEQYKNNTIQSNTLDDMVENRIIETPVLLLHYDVEGMEFDVLKGSQRTILNNKPTIVVELLKKNKDSQTIIDYLKSLGYQGKAVDESCCFGDLFDSKKCRNYIFRYVGLGLQS